MVFIFNFMKVKWPVLLLLLLQHTHSSILTLYTDCPFETNTDESCHNTIITTAYYDEYTTFIKVNSTTYLFKDNTAIKLFTTETITETFAKIRPLDNSLDLHMENTEVQQYSSDFFPEQDPYITQTPDVDTTTLSPHNGDISYNQIKGKVLGSYIKNAVVCLYDGGVKLGTTLTDRLGNWHFDINDIIYNGYKNYTLYSYGGINTVTEHINVLNMSTQLSLYIDDETIKYINPMYDNSDTDINPSKIMISPLTTILYNGRITPNKLGLSYNDIIQTNYMIPIESHILDIAKTSNIISILMKMLIHEYKTEDIVIESIQNLLSNKSLNNINQYDIENLLSNVYLHTPKSIVYMHLINETISAENITHLEKISSVTDTLIIEKDHITNEDIDMIDENIRITNITYQEISITESNYVIYIIGGCIFILIILIAIYIFYNCKYKVIVRGKFVY